MEEELDDQRDESRRVKLGTWFGRSVVTKILFFRLLRGSQFSITV